MTRFPSAPATFSASTNSSGFGPWTGSGNALRGLSQRNHVSKARRNTAHHYDLDGRLYELFLDQDRQYSCAYFEREGDEPR